MQLDLRPIVIQPKGASFELDILCHDGAGRPLGRMQVTAAELLEWATKAAGYSEQFTSDLRAALAAQQSAVPARTEAS